MKNKRGFTLVELLAVIVVLAIIALIGYTVVGDVISGAQESADKENVREYARSVRLAITSAQMNGETVSGTLSNDWLTDNVEKTGNEVVCSSVTDNNGTITLSGCSVGGSTQKYCYNGTDVTTCTRANNNIVKIYGISSGFGEKTKNLFDVNNFIALSTGKRGVSFQEKDDRNCVRLENPDWRNIGILVELVTDKTYVLSYDGYLDNDGTVGGAGFAAVTSDGTYIYNIVDRAKYRTWHNKVSAVIEDGIKVVVSLNSSGTTYIDLNSIQLEESSTKTTYEPFGYKISITATKEDETETDIIVYIGGDKLGANDYLSYDGSNWKVVRNGNESGAIMVTGTVPDGKVTYSVDDLDDSNIVYNYE